jgi:hypothetical protein
MTDRFRGMVFLFLIVVLFSLSACSVIQERLEMGTLMSGQVPIGPGNLTPGAPDLPEDEGLGGGGEDDGLQGSGAIGTAIQQTVDARNTMTAVAQSTASSMSNQQTPTNTANVTLTVPVQQLTDLAQTLTAIVVSSTPTIDQIPSMTPSPTEIYTPSPTPTNFTPTPTEAPCNALRFVAHVTFPPGSIVQPDTGFFKQWSVQNIGSCTWTPSYSLVYHSGFQLGGKSPLYLGGYFQPGEFVQLGIQLYSNPQPGTYKSAWMLQDAQGNTFGGGPNGDEPLIVEIIVPGQPQPYTTSPAVTPPPFYTSTPSP